jgi:sensor histidine kinase YesM
MKTLWLFFILAFFSIISIYILMKKMNVLNVVGCYFLSNILITNTGVIINLNLKLTKQDPSSQLIFWTQKIPEMSLKPALLLWLVYIIFSKRSIFSKLIHLFIFLTALISIELYFVQIGYLQWVNWNVFYGYLRYSLIILLMALYSFYFEKLIFKDKVVNT